MKAFPGWRTVGQALHWARKHHGAALTHEKRPTSLDRTLRSWDAGNTAVWAVWTPGHHQATLHAEVGLAHLQIDVEDGQTAVDVLAALDVLPGHLATLYRLGRVAGASALMDTLTAELDTYAVIERTGKDAFPGGGA